MNHSASQLWFTLSRSHAPTSGIDRGEIACLRARSAINYPSMVSIIAASCPARGQACAGCIPLRTCILNRRFPFSDHHCSCCLSSVQPHRLALGDLDRALGVLAPGADVGEHVEDDEIGKRRGRLLAHLAEPARGERALGRLTED